MPRKNVYLENIKASSFGYLITAIVIVFSYLIYILIYLLDLLIVWITKGTINTSPNSWFLNGVMIITGIFALLTLLITFSYQIRELIKITFKK